MLKLTIKIAVISLGLLFINCKNNSKNIAQNLKSTFNSFEVKGFNIVCYDQLNLDMLEELKVIGTTHIVINMVSDIYIGPNIEPHFDDSQHEPFKNLNDYSPFINKAHDMGFQVMLKPLIKVSNLNPSNAIKIELPDEVQDIKDPAERKKRTEEYINTIHLNSIIPKKNISAKAENKMWHGDFDFENKEHWTIWENIYKEHILKIANYANSMGVSMIGVGNEIDGIAVDRSDYMKSLIKRVRTVFKGEIIYASNWDRYDKIKFWDDVDYISMSGYFPLGNDETPNVGALKNNWKKYLSDLKNISATYDKPILFTEYGYRSMNHNTKEPWQFSIGEGIPNNQAQVNAFQAFFDTFENEPWFAGGFIWKWTCIQKSRHIQDYSPEDKPALETIKEFFKD